MSESEKPKKASEPNYGPMLFEMSQSLDGISRSVSAIKTLLIIVFVVLPLISIIFVWLSYVSSPY